MAEDAPDVTDVENDKMTDAYKEKLSELVCILKNNNEYQSRFISLMNEIKAYG